MKQARAYLLDTEPFEDAFGPKRKRKRPKLLAVDYESLIKKADGSQGKLLPIMTFIQGWEPEEGGNQGLMSLKLYLTIV